MISFTINVKNEITKTEQHKPEKIAELSAFLRLNYNNDNKIEINTENSSIARRIFKFVKDIYNVTPVIKIKKRRKTKGKTLYSLQIEDAKSILLDLAIIDNENDYIPNPKEYITGDEEQKRAYLRGAFLANGSINNPKTSRYHLEFLIKMKSDSEFVSKLLNYFDLNSKIIKRNNGYMVYVKEAEKIGDFLRIVNAGNAVLFFEDIRIYRDHKNMSNRLNNCEQANVDKIINTANKQIKQINKLIENDVFDLLDEKMKETAEYRLKYNESSLEELSTIITMETGNKISKSGLNHRLRKIKKIVEEL